MKISPTLPTIAHPYQLDTFTITELTADTPITIRLGTTTILQATLTPDPSGTITFTDMGRYISERATELAIDTFDALPLTITAATTQLANITLFPCRDRLTATCQDIIAANFLTPAVAGPKLIPLDAQQELLTWYVHQPDDIRLEAIAQWVDYTTHQRCEQRQYIHPSRGTDHVKQADVAPHLLEPPTIPGTWHLITYQVTLGPRLITYTIAPDGYPSTTPITLTFRNIFGHLDTFYLYGTRTTQIKPTYTSALVNGHTLNYQIDSNPTYQVHTGHMPQGTYALFRDLITSPHIYDADGTPITITEVEVKPTNDPTDTLTATITYRQAPESGINTALQSISTFDQTFDNSFN